MKVKITKESDERIEFELDGAQTYFANALRRIAMSSIPAVAIDTVMFYENTSSSFDEYIANRIGLIPLKAPLGYSPKGGFALLSLDKKGPCTVYSSDLKSKDGSVKIALPNIPILKLLEHHSIRIEAKAVSGTAQKHAKFQSCIASYEKNGDSFSFFVESFHQVPAKKILVASAEMLEEKAEEFSKEVSKLKD